MFENREKIIIVLEYASGGELYDYVASKGCLSEAEARRIFRQIVSATLYCHRVGLVCDAFYTINLYSSKSRIAI